MTLTFSRNAARIFGPLIIAIETWRRWNQFGDIHAWPAIADDYLTGGFLFYAATVATLTMKSRRRLYLAAAWGVGTGMMYGSFFSQLQRAAEPDPSGLPVLLVLIAKAIGFLVCLGGLVSALREYAENSQGSIHRG